MKTPFYALILCVVWSIGVNAQTPTPSPAPASTPTPVSLEDYRKILDNERKLLEDQSEKYYTRIDTLINRTLTVISAIGILAGLLIAWRFGRTRSELTSIVDDQFKAKAASQIDADMKLLKESVGSEVAVLTSSIQSLRTKVEELQAFQEQRIVWVFSGVDMNAQQELDALHASGLTEIATLGCRA